MTDLREFKKIVAYARKSGAKRIKVGEIEVEFNDIAPFLNKPDTPAPADKQAVPSGPPEPTLQQIQAWIHQNDDEAHEPH